MTLPALAEAPTPRPTDDLPTRPTSPDRLLTEKRRRIVADIRANGRRLNWAEARVVDGIRIALNLTPLAAYRLWRWWTAAEAVELIRAAASEQGVETMFTTGDLEAWESGHARVPVDLLDAVCLAYRTRPDLIGYRDYTGTGTL